MNDNDKTLAYKQETPGMAHEDGNGRSYNAKDFKIWLDALKPPKISDKSIILVLKKKWEDLYGTYRSGGIDAKEYAQRRKVYDEMIWELADVLDVFLEDYLKEMEGVRKGRTKKNLIKFLFKQRFGRYFRGRKMIFIYDEKTILLPKTGRLHENHWNMTRQLLEDNNWTQMLTEFDRLFGI